MTDDKQKHVLVVDDHPINLKLASYVLESAGFNVSQAADATEALAEIERAAPDLILMDIALPGMDGLSLTEKLKSDPKTEGICVIALTAYAMKGDDQRAMNAGCDGYLSKPIDTRKLADQVNEFLSKHCTR